MRLLPGVSALLLAAMAASPAWSEAPAKPPVAGAAPADKPAPGKPEAEKAGTGKPASETPPAGKPQQNWIKTLPDKGWFTYFRLYAPTQPYFDKTWVLPDIAEVD